MLKCELPNTIEYIRNRCRWEYTVCVGINIEDMKLQASLTERKRQSCRDGIMFPISKREIMLFAVVQALRHGVHKGGG